MLLQKLQRFLFKGPAQQIVNVRKIIVEMLPPHPTGIHDLRHGDPFQRLLGHELLQRSTGLLPVVLGIEAGEDPDTLVKQNRLPELVNWYQALGAEALVLGCTHFPYFKEALLRQITLPVIDPAEEMLRLLNT